MIGLAAFSAVHLVHRIVHWSKPHALQILHTVIDNEKLIYLEDKNDNWEMKYIFKFIL